MKVVLFCGGLGTRLKDYSETIPKPMVPIGQRPIIWHIMKYYAHYGHKDFILALGYKGDYIKNYFLNYREEISNDFTISDGGKKVELISTDTHDWTITLVDTGIDSNVGTRLMKLKHLLKDEDVFLANYSDGLTDMHLPDMIREFENDKNAVASFMTSKPQSSLHEVQVGKNGLVNDIQPFTYSNSWINAGYFILKPEIFDYMETGEELVLKPFQRLIKENKLRTYSYKGFWKAMDTFKDKMILDGINKNEISPWKVWKNNLK
jgi:glucose-1-phosphate cytidylyltransferase